MKASAMTRHSRGRRLSALAVVMAVALAALGFWGLWTLTVDFLSCSPAGLLAETRWRYDLADGLQIRGGMTDGAALVRAKNESVLMAVVPFDVTAFCTGDGYIGTHRTQRDGTVTYALIDSKSGETVGFYNTQEGFESACAEAGAVMGAWTSTGEAPEDAVFEACYVVDESPEYIEGNFLGSLGALFLNIEDSASVSAPYTPYDGSRLVRLRFDGESAALLAACMREKPDVWQPLSAMPEALAERAFSERPLPFPCICLDAPCFIPRAENGFWHLDGTEHSISGSLYLFNTDTGELYNYTW